MRSWRRSSASSALLLIAGAAAAADSAPDGAAGHAVFDHSCAMCHAPGPTYAGTVALGAKYKGALPAALEQRTDLTAALVRLYVRQGVGLMPPFRKTEVSDAQLAALAAYLAGGAKK